MIPGLDIIAGTLFYFAVGTVNCAVPEAPRVKITPVTKTIEYDFSRSRNDLDKIRAERGASYEVGADRVTGGLRHDTPKTILEVQIGYQQYPDGQTCFWYDSIDFKVKLQPKIFVAREYDSGKCHEAILEHEERHVQVDRKIVNKMANEIGNDLRDAVNKTGAIGPYPIDRLSEIKTMMVEFMQDITTIHQEKFEREMDRLQSQVDTPEEYERISRICHREGY